MTSVELGKPVSLNVPRFPSPAEHPDEYAEAVRDYAESLRERYDSHLEFRISDELVCCPKCLKTDTNNKTSRLNRTQRRRGAKIQGFQVDETAYCVHCNSRMVHMPAEERLKRLTEKENNRAEVRKRP